MLSENLKLERWQHGDVLCRVVLGITCYFEQAPSHDDIVRAYSIYRTKCPPERRTLIKTARQSLFMQIETDDLRHLNMSLAEQDRRRDEGIVIWDGYDAQQWMFWMQGVVGRTPDEHCASFCQIFMPEDTNHEVLADLALGMGENLPLLSAHAGYTVQFLARLKYAAFRQIYIWAKRFIGLEVEDLNCTLPYVLNAVKGANWLTLVGHQLWDRLPVQWVDEQTLPKGVTLEVLRYARLFRAGSRPVLGDRNRREFPYLYAAVERVLTPIKLSEHPEFSGRFTEENETDAWLHRLTDPDAW